MTEGRASLATAVALLAAGGGGLALAAPPLEVEAAGGAGRHLAMLTRATPVLAGPAAGARRTGRIAAVRPITGAPTVLPVIGRARDADGAPWVKVLLPGRPNGHSGWIAAASTDLSTTSWRVSVRLSSRRVSVFRDGRRVRSFPAVVGAPSTPTPVGRFFVEETVALADGYAGAPHALALSARSEVFQEFEGGPGQVAVHGTENIAGTVGTAVSHGCIRLDTAAVTWMAGHIGAGTRVDITP